MNKTEAQCHAACVSSFREDRAAGLIYGPYAIETYGTVMPENDPAGLYAGNRFTDRDGDEMVYVNSFVFAAASGQCTYCGPNAAPLPKGRKRYLMRFVPACLRVAVALAWRNTEPATVGEDDGPELLPQCVQAMQCYCAGHARGNPACDPCDTRETCEDVASVGGAA